MSGPGKAQLLISDDGTLYHIDLKKNDDIPNNILLVGSASRVDQIAEQLDKVTFSNRNKARPEFYAIAGSYRNTPILAFSVGIGVSNIEIAVNELHALFEYDAALNSWSDRKPKINIIRVGTCGTSIPSVEIGHFAISSHSIGLDNLASYYRSKRKTGLVKKIDQAFLKTKIGRLNPLAYCSSASPIVVNALQRSAMALGEDKRTVTGITTASPGFYAPEGRQIGRLQTRLSFEEFLSTIQSFKMKENIIVNHEMETSILFRLGHEMLGYNTGAICLVLDNLATNELLDHSYAKKRMDQCIRIALESMVALSSK